MSDNTRNRINKNVCSEVVAYNLCIGCGVCVGICPRDNLRIEFNQYGEYNAFEKGVPCAEGCGLCLKVCPFYDNGENEDAIGTKLFAETSGIRHRPETGYYLNAFVGYSNVDDHRKNGASGGLATWLLETLFKEKLIDKAVCVGASIEQEKLFSYTICNSPEEIRRCSRSKYYPVETSGVIRHMLANEGRYAVTVQPCFAKAFRLAMQVHPKLQQRVKFLLGPTCGHGKSKFFVELACALKGGDPHNLDEFHFRVKDPQRIADDFINRFVTNAGTPLERSGVVHFLELDMSDRYFTYNACNLCTDTFNELADVAFMDAWIAPYNQDHRGHSIVLVRNTTILSLIQQGLKDDTLAMQDFSIDKVIESQKGLVHSKRNFTPERSRLAIQAGYKVPKTRIALLSGKLPYTEKLLAKATWLISLKSREEWLRCNKDLKRFQKAMAPYAAALRRAKLAKLLNRLRQNPCALLGALWRHFVRYWKWKR